ncbi:MAG: amino acid ABC transporter permease [Bilophila wadsworthia]
MTGNGIASGGIWGAGRRVSSPARCSTGWHDRIALFGCPAVAAGLGAALLRLSRLWRGGMAHVWRVCEIPRCPSVVFVYFLFAPAMAASARPCWPSACSRGVHGGTFRAGLQSVPRAQWEAGISLGLGVWNTLRLVILPQAVRRMLPPLTSQLVSLIKDTSLVSAIAVADLTMQAQVLIADTFLAFEIWLIVAALYLALTLCVALPARWMERRYAWR